MSFVIGLLFLTICILCVISEKNEENCVRIESIMSLTKCEVMDLTGLISHFFGSFWSGLNCGIRVYPNITG